VGRTNSTINYSLDFETDNDFEGYVFIDRWAGVIRLRRAFDREINAFHRFTVLATTENGRTANLSVLLTVLDSNDHSPVFSHPSYLCHVTSTTVPDIPVCTVTATDLDEKENGRIVYFLTADDHALDIFRIDAFTGAIYINRAASGNRTLTVVATDAGALPRKSSALVMVTSDVLPAVNCAVESLEMSVEENQPAHSIVGSVRLVYEEGNSVIVTRYHLIQDGGQQEFDVNRETGEIVTKAILDREVSASHVLSVSAVYSLPGKLIYLSQLLCFAEPFSAAYMTIMHLS